MKIVKYIIGIVLVLAVVSLSYFFFGRNTGGMTVLACADMPKQFFFDSSKGKYSGKEVEILEKIFAEMKQKFKIKNLSFDILFNKAKNESCIVASGLTDKAYISLDRSIPYSRENTVLLTLKSGEKLSSVAVQSGSTYEELIKNPENVLLFKKAMNNSENIEIISVSDFDKSIQMLKSGKVDAIITNSIVADGIKEVLINAKSVNIMSGNNFVFYFGDKTSQEFKDEFNRILKDVISKDNSLSFKCLVCSELDPFNENPECFC